jgi:hypothetical protein
MDQPVEAQGQDFDEQEICPDPLHHGHEVLSDVTN